MPVGEGEMDLPDEWEGPLDPARDEAATSPGPPLSSQAPADSTDPLTADVADQGEVEQDEEELPEFDPRFREEFDGLLFLGFLRDTFTWAGHTFQIRTMRVDELLEVALVSRPYVGTLGEAKGYQSAVVAAVVERVDGKPMPMPITNEPSDTPLKARFDFVLRSWFPPVIDVIYDRYMALEDKARQVLDAMGKVSAPMASTPG